MPTARLAAITLSLDWQYRRTCSGDKFDPLIAERYIAEHVDRACALMAKAADDGAELVLGPEYLRSSELFTTTPAQRRALVDTVDGETTRRLRTLSGARGIYLAGSFDMRHGDIIAQTGVITGRQGELVGTHVKRKPGAAGLWSAIPDMFDLDIGRTAMLICSDVTDDPAVPLALAADGLALLLVPGCGFAGPYWREFILVRAMDCRCAVVYADESHALIVDARGQILAETDRPDAVIWADVDIEIKDRSLHASHLSQ